MDAALKRRAEAVLDLRLAALADPSLLPSYRAARSQLLGELAHGAEQLEPPLDVATWLDSLVTA